MPRKFDHVPDPDKWGYAKGVVGGVTGFVTTIMGFMACAVGVVPAGVPLIVAGVAGMGWAGKKWHDTSAARSAQSSYVSLPGGSYAIDLAAQKHQNALLKTVCAGVINELTQNDQLTSSAYLPTRILERRAIDDQVRAQVLNSRVDLVEIHRTGQLQQYIADMVRTVNPTPSRTVTASAVLSPQPSSPYSASPYVPIAQGYNVGQKSIYDESPPPPPSAPPLPSSNQSQDWASSILNRQGNSSVPHGTRFK